MIERGAGEIRAGVEGRRRWGPRALAIPCLLTAVAAAFGCGEDINAGAFDPRGPGGAVREREPNGSPDLAQVLEPVQGEEMVLTGSFFGVGLTSGELDFYKLATPGEGGPFALALSLTWETESDFNMALYGNGVANFDGFTTQANPETAAQEVGAGLAYDLLLLALTGEPGDYELRILLD